MKRKDILAISAGNASANNIFGSYFDLFVVSLGGTPLLQSILMSVRNLGNNLLQSLWGNLSDRYGRKLFLALGFLGMAVTTVSFIFIRNPSYLIILVALQVLIGSMAIPAWNGLLGDLTERSERGRVIGSVSSVGTLFSVIMLLFVGYASQQVVGELRQYYLIFIIASLVFLFTTIVSLSISKTPFVSKRNSIRFLDVVKRDRRFLKFVLAYTTYLFSMALAWPLFSFVTVKIVAATKSQVSIIWASGQVAAYLSQRFGGIVTDRIGRRKSLFFFFLPLAITTFCFGIATSWWWLLAGNVIAGFATGAGFVAVAAYTLDCASDELRASYSGTINLISGVGTFAASLISGVVSSYLLGIVGLASMLRIMFLSVTVLRILAAFTFLKVEEPFG